MGVKFGLSPHGRNIDQGIWERCGGSSLLTQTSKNNRRIEKIFVIKNFNLYPSPNIVRLNKLRKMRWVVHAVRFWEVRYVSLVAKSWEKRPFGRLRLWGLRLGWEDNIKTNFTQVGFEVIAVVGAQIVVFWVVAPCCLVFVWQHFRGICCFHLQG
jgi:hypothetical protein